MKKFEIYLNLSGKFDSRYVYITSMECKQIGESLVELENGIIINFDNEILGINEV